MKTTNRETDRNEISSIIAEILEEEFVLFEENAKLVEDIGLDSMGFLELAIQIQRSFGTIIPNEEWKNIITIQDLLDTIEKKQQKDE
ncbi:MAG: acyl carrier protein [Bacteroidales bacterium]|nr:acyl carrier protein [Bacteroidales bacterium]MDD3907932.1 acyl carrier protein [Bacteroidales bacterium]MDD4712226.1 acyl carrier protein [Bacteroidales bacterium]